MKLHDLRKALEQFDDEQEILIHLDADDYAGEMYLAPTFEIQKIQDFKDPDSETIDLETGEIQRQYRNAIILSASLPAEIRRYAEAKDNGDFSVLIEWDIFPTPVHELSDSGKHRLADHQDFDFTQYYSFSWNKIVLMHLAARYGIDYKDIEKQIGSASSAPEDKGDWWHEQLEKEDRYLKTVDLWLQSVCLDIHVWSKGVF